mmetsp:Transcript_45392/g.92728  ORF Transcript_45392/g.92728 Transcript_45392/m.92728 type:complete len:265 (+) Transcript_45392:337-1131(+)
MLHLRGENAFRDGVGFNDARRDRVDPDVTVSQLLHHTSLHRVECRLGHGVNERVPGRCRTGGQVHNGSAPFCVRGRHSLHGFLAAHEYTPNVDIHRIIKVLLRVFGYRLDSADNPGTIHESLDLGFVERIGNPLVDFCPHLLHISNIADIPLNSQGFAPAFIDFFSHNFRFGRVLEVADDDGITFLRKKPAGGATNPATSTRNHGDLGLVCVQGNQVGGLGGGVVRVVCGAGFGVGIRDFIDPESDGFDDFLHCPRERWSTQEH